MAKSYYEKLKDPRWQKKRLEILERADFCCEDCGDEESTLHVHHGYYEKGLDPWDYANNTLWCLCEGCHFEIEIELTKIRKILATGWPGYLDTMREWIEFGSKLIPPDLDDIQKNYENG